MSTQHVVKAAAAVCLLIGLCASGAQSISAQRPVPVPTIPKVPPVYIPPPPPPTPRPPVTKPPVVIRVPPPAPPVTPGRIAMPIAPCRVTSADSLGSTDCERRYITSAALRRDLAACRGDGPCYARKLLRIDRSPTPVVVQYPQAPAALAVARAEVRAELVAAARAMAVTVERRIAGGEPNLPSVQGLNRLVESAISAVDRIEVPLESGVEDSMRRLAALIGS